MCNRRRRYAACNIMKLTRSVFMVAVLWQAVLVHTSSLLDDYYKRELNEGNFGLKIKPEAGKATNSLANGDKETGFLGGIPEKDYGLPKEPVAKISDVLSGQGVSFPAAIQSHLYSPLPVYQPRLGSPTTFEISPPVPYKLAYAGHEMYQMNEQMNEQMNRQIKLLNQNIQQLQSQTINPFIAITPPTTTPTNDLLQRLKNKPLTSWSPQIYQQLFPTVPGEDPSDIYQQINHLQLPYEEFVQVNLDNPEKDAGNTKEQNTLDGYDATKQILNKEQENTLQTVAQSNQTASTPRPLAISYASFTQNIPKNPQNEITGKLSLQSFTLPPQDQPLPLHQSPPLFQQIQTHPPALPLTSTTHAPGRIGVIRIRQGTPPSQQQQTSSTTYFSSSTSMAPIIVEETYTTEPTLESSPTLLPQPQAPLNTFPISAVRTQTIFPRPTLPPLPPLPRRPLQTLSPLPVFSFRTQPPTSSPLPLSTPQFTFPTVSPPTVRPQFIQSTAPPLLASTQSIPTSSETIPTIQSLQETTPQPLLIQPASFNAAEQFQQLQIKSEPQLVVQKTSEKVESPQPQRQPITISHQEQVLIHTPQSQRLLPLFQQEPIDLTQQTDTFVYPNQAIQLSPFQPSFQPIQLRLQPSQQIKQEHSESESTKKPTENEPQNKSETQPEDAKQKIESEKTENQTETPKAAEEKDFYSEFIKNLYTAEASYYQNPSLFVPVPVEFPSFPNSFLPPPPPPNPIYPQIPSYQVPSFHNAPTAVSALQFYENFAPNVFGNPFIGGR